ncbi:glycosyl hydrolase 2 galactose-binding domain-containing protein [Poriferisphaera sp. WC338]|uniref:glycoside hydrolase family 2 protein n=1 Tax=Poriferisphaera sp. WC338 TaxID=3425129 RepID=UPI003D81837C
MKRQYLNQFEWVVKAIGDQSKVPSNIKGMEIPASVPGCVHTDLLTARLIDDPYYDRNELNLKWIGWTNWSYTCRFTIDDDLAIDEYATLVCEGLDTLAELKLNGQVIGEANNMHRRWRFDLRKALKTGDNELEIIFSSPMKHITSLAPEFKILPFTGSGSNPQLPHNLIRKMGCNFGWDWGPALVTSGIWRKIYIERWTCGRIGDMRPEVVRADSECGEVILRVDTVINERTDNCRIHYALKNDKDIVVAEGNDLVGSEQHITIENPQLWWPIGYGKQSLYKLEVWLVDNNRNVLDRKSRRLGIKTSKLITELDPEEIEGLGKGESYFFKINGQRVYCKGANWIPDDCFPHRVDRKHYEEKIQLALDSNMNMLRVWGGGTYEDEAFYDVCDERGVMVWQDFCFACACYPETEPFWGSVEAEARDNIARLCSHASLTVWNGCNENIWGMFDWGEEWTSLREQNEVGWGGGYYLNLLPKCVEQLDPGHPYWAGSPFSGNMQRTPNANEFGNRHIWDVWNGEGGYRNYMASFPRFASEFGFHGPATWPTIQASVPEQEHEWFSESMIHHNKQTDGQRFAIERIAESFKVPDSFEDQWFLASLNQARALELGCEWLRALSPWNGGSLYWQFNDCWPVASWAAVDGPGRRKYLWYATRRFYRPKLLTIKPTNPIEMGANPTDLSVYLHNDSAEVWKGTVEVRCLNINGEEVGKFSSIVNVESRGQCKFPLTGISTLEGVDLIVASIDNERGYWFCSMDFDLEYPQPQLTIDVEHLGNKCHLLHIKAESLVRDLCFFADRLEADAIVSDQMITMLPGDIQTLHVDGLSDNNANNLKDPAFYNCANHYGKCYQNEKVLVNSQ